MLKPRELPLTPRYAQDQGLVGAVTTAAVASAPWSVQRMMPVLDQPRPTAPCLERSLTIPASTTRPVTAVAAQTPAST
jgi:hypothetical protein